MEGSCRDLVYGNMPTLLERVEETMNDNIHCNRSPNRYLKPGTPKYENDKPTAGRWRLTKQSWIRRLQLKKQKNRLSSTNNARRMMSVRVTDSYRKVCPWQRKTVVQIGINIDQKFLFMKCRNTKQLMLQKQTVKPSLSNRKISNVLDCWYVKQTQFAAKT